MSATTQRKHKHQHPHKRRAQKIAVGLGALTIIGTQINPALALQVAGHDVGAPVRNTDAGTTLKDVPVDYSALDAEIAKAQAAGFTVNVTDGAPTQVANTEVGNAVTAANQSVNEQIKKLQDAQAKYDQDAAARQNTITEGDQALEAKKAELQKVIEQAAAINITVTEGKTPEVKGDYPAASAAYDEQIKAIKALIEKKTARDAELAKNRIVQPQKTLKCEPLHVASLNDISNSITYHDANGKPAELTQIKEANKKLVEKLSTIPGATITFFTFGKYSPVGYQKAVDYNNGTGERRVIDGNLPSVAFDVSTDAGKQQALNWIDGITPGQTEDGRDVENVPQGDIQQDTANLEALSTNTKAGLEEVEKYSKKYSIDFNAVLINSDGVPTSGGARVGQPGDFNEEAWGSISSLEAAQQVIYRLEQNGSRVFPVMIADPADPADPKPAPWTLHPEAAEAMFKQLANSKNPVEGKDYWRNQNIADLANQLEAAIDEACPTYEAAPVKVEVPETPKPVVDVVKPRITTPTPATEKVADNENKIVLAGQETTQHISQSTGHRDPDVFVLGDNIRFVQDKGGALRSPVSVDPTKVTVTNEAGENVTDWFTIKVEDVTDPDGARVRQVTAEAKSEHLKDLGANKRYTLNVTQKAELDGVADQEIDYGFSIVNDQYVFTEDHTYTEYIPAPKKTVKNHAGVEVDGKTVLPGQELNYELTLDVAKFKDSQGTLDSLGSEDDYDEHYYTPTGKFEAKTADGTDVSDWFTFADKDGKATLTAKAEKLAEITALGQNIHWTLFGHVNQDAKPGGFTNTVAQITNGDRQNSNTVTNQVPNVTPHKTVATSGGYSADSRAVLPGQKLNYHLTLAGDTLTNLSDEVTKHGITDHFNKDYYQVDTEKPVSVYSTPIELKTGTDTGTESKNQMVEEDLSKFKVTVDNEKGVATVELVNPADGVGKNYYIVLHGTVKKDAKPGEFTNTATQFTNDYTKDTETVKNHVPNVDPHKYDLHPENGQNIDGKTVEVGNVLNYTLNLDTTKLTDSAYTINRVGMRDDYDEQYVKLLKDRIKVYQVNPEVQLGEVSDVAGVVAAQGKDVTDKFTINDDGKQAVVEMNKNEDGTLALPMGARYIIVLPAEVIKNTDGDIKNTAYQFVNDNEYVTETVVNRLKKIEPHKDVVVNVGDKDSINGTEIPLNTTFNYKLSTHTRAADSASTMKELALVDKYDKEHDKYDGQFKAITRYDVYGEDGNVRYHAGDDVTEHFTQKHDAAGGVVTFEAKLDWIKLMNQDANKKTEQGVDVYMSVTRTKAAERIENKVTERYNGNTMDSNVVWTKTPEKPVEPPKPDTPPTPNTPPTTGTVPPPATVNPPVKVETPTPTPSPSPAPAPSSAPAQGKVSVKSGINGGHDGFSPVGLGLLGVGAAAVTVGAVYAVKRRKDGKNSLTTEADTE